MSLNSIQLYFIYYKADISIYGGVRKLKGIRLIRIAVFGHLRYAPNIATYLTGHKSVIP